MASEYILNHQPKKFDIIRSDSKDKYYKSKQAALVNNLLAVFPQINADQCRLISDCLYYSLTTLLSRQTLGEESYYLIEFGRNKNIPRLLNRVVMVTLKVYVPYIVKRMQPNLELLSLVLLFFKKQNDLVFILSKIHAYSSLENMFSGIKYLSLLDKRSSNETNLGLIGALKAVNLAVFSVCLIKKWKRKQWLFNDRRQLTEPTKLPETESMSQQGTNKCSICLEILKKSTLTSCGHLFCWDCIQSYASNVNNSKGSFICPSCRLEINTDKLIFLHNF